MNVERFISLRPYAFHVTASPNLHRIRRTGRLESAALLCARAGRKDLLLAKRATSEEIRVGRERIVIRDQRPLNEKNMDLGGKPLLSLLGDLNSRVFLWTGSHDGLGPYGRRHLERYRSEAPVILRVPMGDLLAMAKAELCRYNSGSPRRYYGRPIPRGSTTFVPLSHLNEAPGRVVEVTFRGSVVLPKSTAWSNAAMGTWRKLFVGRQTKTRISDECPGD